MSRGITGVMISNGLPPDMVGEVALTITGDRETLHAIAEDLTSRMLGQISIVPETPQPSARALTCVTCGASSKDVPIEIKSSRCTECVAGGWFPEGGAARKTLSATELDALPATATVIAGASPDGRRTERVRWVKLHNGRWETARQERVDDTCGVSSIWLANNRRPMCDDGRESV